MGQATGAAAERGERMRRSFASPRAAAGAPRMRQIGPQPVTPALGPARVVSDAAANGPTWEQGEHACRAAHPFPAATVIVFSAATRLSAPLMSPRTGVAVEVCVRHFLDHPAGQDVDGVPSQKKREPELYLKVVPERAGAKPGCFLGRRSVLCKCVCRHFPGHFF